jgi:hypothetical protein
MNEQSNAYVLCLDIESSNGVLVDRPDSQLLRQLEPVIQAAQERLGFLLGQVDVRHGGL